MDGVKMSGGGLLGLVGHMWSTKNLTSSFYFLGLTRMLQKEWIKIN